MRQIRPGAPLSEQTAAQQMSGASKEPAAQAARLMDLVGQFKRYRRFPYDQMNRAVQRASAVGTPV